MLRGTIVPLVTPFADDESIDEAALERLVDAMVDADADGLMPTALTGEGPLLSEPETLQVWDAVCARNDERLPVIPAIVTLTTTAACATRPDARATAAGLGGPQRPRHRLGG